MALVGEDGSPYKPPREALISNGNSGRRLAELHVGSVVFLDQ